MTTLFQSYILGLRAVLQNAPGFPAMVEKSPVRASSRNEPKIICVLPGAEDVQSSPIGRSTRIREFLLLVHTAGDEHLELAEEVFEAAHPLVMGFDGEGIVSVTEHGTDEPKYVNGDLTRQAITKRYRITYQTDEHSLSE